MLWSLHRNGCDFIAYPPLYGTCGWGVMSPGFAITMTRVPAFSFIHPSHPLTEQCIYVGSYEFYFVQLRYAVATCYLKNYLISYVLNTNCALDIDEFLITRSEFYQCYFELYLCYELPLWFEKYTCLICYICVIQHIIE